MEKSREVLGHIIKEETISLLNHHILPNTVVINIDHPFPGFHGADFHIDTKPRSVVIATDKLYSLAKILRAQKRINQLDGFDISASFAKIKIGSKLHYGIRIKKLAGYEQIPGLQKEFQNLGFELLKNKRIKTDKPVSIKISKFFHINKLESGIYEDACNKHIYYIKIPDYVNWETFREITLHVKNNISNNNFDVVKGIFYKNDCVMDIIRIYKPNISLDLLQEIKKRYASSM